jgi:hypothetical protein
LPLALIFQAIHVDQVALVSALVVQLASAPMSATTTTSAPPTNAFKDKEETDAPSLQDHAAMVTCAQLMVATPQLVAVSPLSSATTEILALTTSASEQQDARVSLRSVLTMTPAPSMVAVPAPDAPSPNFLHLSALSAAL